MNWFFEQIVKTRPCLVGTDYRAGNIPPLLWIVAGGIIMLILIDFVW